MNAIRHNRSQRVAEGYIKVEMFFLLHMSNAYCAVGRIQAAGFGELIVGLSGVIINRIIGRRLMC